MSERLTPELLESALTATYLDVHGNEMSRPYAAIETRAFQEMMVSRRWLGEFEDDAARRRIALTIADSTKEIDHAPRP